MTSYSWLRGINAEPWGLFQWQLLDSLAAGVTLRRIRFRWGFYGDTAVTADLAFAAVNLMTLGFVTTIGDGTETPPNPRTASGDAAPPTERWVYWESRAPVATAVDVAGNLVTWRDSGSTEETSTRGQVLATGLGSSPFLNVWVCTAAPYVWDPSGSAIIWYSWSMLVSA